MRTEKMIHKTILTGHLCYIKNTNIAYEFSQKDKAKDFCNKMNDLITREVIEINRTAYQETAVMTINKRAKQPAFINIEIDRNGTTKTVQFKNDVRGNKEAFTYLDEEQKKFRKDNEFNSDAKITVAITQGNEQLKQWS